jgi:hypothetical protein
VSVRHALLPTLAFLACAFAPADAQLRASMGIGGGEIGYGVVPSPAVVMNGRVDLQRGWLHGTASGSLSRFENTSASSSVANAEVLLRPPHRRGLTGELRVFGASTNHHDFYRASRVEGRAGASWVSDVVEATVRYGLANVAHDRLSVVTNRIEVEASSALGPTLLTVFGSHARFSDETTVTRDTTYMVAGFPFRGRYRTEVAVARAYLDGEARLQWALRSAIWGLALGARRGDAGTESDHWQRLDLSVPINPSVALMATAGRRPAVPEERLPAGAFAIFGVQLSFRNAAPPLAAQSADGRDTPRFVALDVGGGRRSISIIGLAARRVEIIADFTDWKPVDLATIGENVWHATLPIAPGAHRISIRVDGRAWMPPPGLPVTADEFMGTVGILLIE